MKMLVSGYDPRMKDPYKFWSKLLDGKPKRKWKRVATYTYVNRIDDKTLAFHYGRALSDKVEGQLLCTLKSDNLWTISIAADKAWPSVGSRLHAITGCYVRADKKGHPYHENPVRISEGWGPRSWPYVQGQQVLRGEVLHKDRLVDRKRVIDEEPAREIKRKLKKIYELAPVMVRLLESHNVDRKPGQYWDRKKLLADWLPHVDVDNINALDAERVYLVGETTTRRYQKWEWAPSGAFLSDEEPIEEYRHRCVVNGLRKLREYVYSKEGVYKYEETK